MKRSELEKLIKEAVAQNIQTKKDVNNTPDEIMFRKAIEANPTIKTRLSAISSVMELDGFFKTLISYTQLDKVSKMSILSSLKKGLDNISTEPMITTKKQQ